MTVSLVSNPGASKKKRNQGGFSIKLNLTEKSPPENEEEKQMAGKVQVSERGGAGFTKTAAELRKEMADDLLGKYRYATEFSRFAAFIFIVSHIF